MANPTLATATATPSKDTELSPAQKKSVQMIQEMDRYLVALNSDVGQRLKDLEAPYDRLFPFCLYDPEKTTAQAVKESLLERVKQGDLTVDTPQNLCKAAFEVVTAQ